MGMFDTVFLDCPKCKTRQEVQTKAGPCELREYDIYGAPASILGDLTNRSPITCAQCKHEIFIVISTSIRIF